MPHCPAPPQYCLPSPPPRLWQWPPHSSLLFQAVASVAGARALAQPPPLFVFVIYINIIS